MSGVIEQEIDTGQAGAVDGAEGGDCQLANMIGEGGGQGGGDDQIGAFVDIFGIIGVKVTGGADFAGDGIYFSI